MKYNIKLALLGTVGALTLPIAAQAQWWNQHPGYLHALSDVRTAFALVHHRAPSDPAQAVEEHHAEDEILAAYRELQQAAVSDGKDINAQFPPDFNWGDRGARLHQARDLLHKAAYEISSEEENPAARGLRDRAKYHIEAANHWLDAAMQFWHF